MLSARLSERGDIGVLFALVERAIHGLLDGQPVIVVSRDVRRAEACEGLRFHHEILEDLVQRGSDMDGAVRVRRPVVQHERGRVFAGLLDRVVEVCSIPLGLHRRLHGAEVRLHGNGEVGVGQVEGRSKVHGRLAVYLWGANARFSVWGLRCWVWGLRT